MRKEKIANCLAAGLAVAFSFAGCSSGPGAAESKMTSYSSAEAKADTASLFTVPPDQMALADAASPRLGVPGPTLMANAGRIRNVPVVAVDEHVKVRLHRPAGLPDRTPALLRAPIQFDPR